ncbi:hypothetical protein Fmac_015536 [Flemingia macrophylla]|uniref:Uncharacterized protein n=1 Tax=Flemingia macrophylla TaxID=520843 RepID=A0ABD1MFQ8_9FABA
MNASEDPMLDYDATPEHRMGSCFCKMLYKSPLVWKKMQELVEVSYPSQGPATEICVDAKKNCINDGVLGVIFLIDNFNTELNMDLMYIKEPHKGITKARGDVMLNLVIQLCGNKYHVS